MGSYNNTNLIKYEDTIRIHFDQTGKSAWLTLMNYGVVFGEKPPDAAMVVTVGIPGTAPYPQTISIGAMLDAINVIKFQVAILEFTSGMEKEVLTPVAVRRVIAKALTVLDKSDLYVFRNRGHFFTSANDDLKDMLNKAPGSPAVMEAIEKYRPDNVGFTAYFPEPSLILQEERTRKKNLVDPPLGKTWNTDTRDIQPILFDMREPSWGEKPGHDRVKDKREFKGEFAQILKKIDTKIQVN